MIANATMPRISSKINLFKFPFNFRQTLIYSDFVAVTFVSQKISLHTMSYATSIFFVYALSRLELETNQGAICLVGVRGFEPPTPASRTQYSTRLSYTPFAAFTTVLMTPCDGKFAQF